MGPRIWLAERFLWFSWEMPQNGLMLGENLATSSKELYKSIFLCQKACSYTCNSKIYMYAELKGKHSEILSPLILKMIEDRGRLCLFNVTDLTLGLLSIKQPYLCFHVTSFLHLYLGE